LRCSITNAASDEIMYHAKLHPEQYSDTFSAAQLKQLHTSILYICQTAVDTLADSEKFPDDWLFKHRWGKGKKDKVMEMPNGAKITFLTVGGRTSCVVPSVQKKTGPTAGDADAKGAEAASGKGGAKKKAAPVVPESEEDDAADDEDPKPKSKKRRADPVPPQKEAKKAKVGGPVKAESESKVKGEVNGTGRRRSDRVSKV
jgi:formamidopyrimidine-DNA glycosylase